MKQKNIDMLNGSIANKILLFALPLAATGILQQLFNAADIAVVGRYVGTNAMAAVGSNSPVIGLLVNGFVGIALGANVVIANYTGQQNILGIKNVVHTSILFSLVGGVCITIFGELISSPLLHLLSVPDDVFPMALAYLRIYLLGMPVIFLYNFEAAIFRSQGDTRTPLLCLIISGIVNVSLNLFFVCVVSMSAGGVALATVLSNLLSAILLFRILQHRRDAIKLEVSYIKICDDALKPVIKIGLPAGLQSMVFSISNICIQSAINSLGSEVMAASSAAFNIEIFAFYLISSFGQTCTTFVGQNYGAGNIARCRKITRISLIMNAGITSVAASVILLFGKQALGIFNKDPEVISLGLIRLFFILAPEVINVVMEIMSGSMRGYGYSLVPAIMTFVGVCGIRITWVYTVFKASPTFLTLMIVYPLSWVVTAIALVIAYLRLMKKLKPLQS